MCFRRSGERSVNHDHTPVSGDGRLRDRVAIVTGAGRGIGRAVGKALAAEGAFVVINNRSDIAGAVVGEIEDAGGAAAAHVGDVGRPHDAEELVATALDLRGRVDIVVNNAGQSVRGTIVDTTDEDFDDTIRVHLKGTFNVTRAAARHWVE